MLLIMFQKMNKVNIQNKTKNRQNNNINKEINNK